MLDRQVLRKILIGTQPKRTLLRIVGLVVLSYIVFRFFLIPVRTAGLSMAPLFSEGKFTFINRTVYLFKAPQRGDVVGVSFPAGSNAMLLKRVIALPDETLRIEKGQVYINEQPLTEPYVSGKEPWDLPSVSLGPEEYFVIGDNRGQSMQSHVMGRVLRKRIVGKVLF